MYRVLGMRPRVFVRVTLAAAALAVAALVAMWAAGWMDSVLLGLGFAACTVTGWLVLALTYGGFPVWSSPPEEPSEQRHQPGR